MKTIFKKMLPAVLLTVLLLNLNGNVNAQWSLTGNAATNPPTNFLGTTDAKDLVLKANATERFRIANSNGHITMGSNTYNTHFLNIMDNTWPSLTCHNQSGTFHYELSSGVATATSKLQLSNLANNNDGVLRYYSNESHDLWLTNNSTGKLRFATASTMGTDVERMTISSAGLVGIGQNTPTEQLHLFGASPYALIEKTSGFGNNGIKFKSDGGTFSIFQDYFPSGGYGLHITPTGTTGTKGVHLVGGGVFFGTGWTAPSHATYYFDDNIFTTGMKMGEFLYGTWVPAKLAIQTSSGSGLTIKSSSSTANEYVSRIECSSVASLKAFGILSSTYPASPVDQFVVYNDGRTVIGAGIPSLPAGYKLFVKDGILAEKVKIALTSDAVNWSDFVFDKNYKLRSLNDVESFIKKNHHLPEIPSAEEVYKEGIDVAQMDAKLLQKIEELTLYLLEQNKRIQELEKLIDKK